MKIFKLIFLGLVVYVVALVATMPAAIAIKQFAPETLEVGPSSGSIWSGKLGTLGLPSGQLRNISWKVSPMALFGLKIGADVEASLADGVIKANVTKGLSDTTIVRDVSGVLSEAGIMQLIGNTGLVSSLGVTTKVGLDLEKLSLNGDIISELVGTVDIVQLKVSRPEAFILGDYTVVFTGIDENGVIRGDILGTEGPFDVSGYVNLTPEARSYELLARVKPTGAILPDHVTSALVFYPPNDQGEHEITLDGVF